MKKIIISIVAVLSILLNINTLFAYETTVINDSYIETVYDDGSYIEINLEQDSHFTRASSTSGKKTSTYKDSNGKILWSVRVEGSFTYTGSSATCTSSSITTTCPASNWKLSNKTSSRSGAAAIASATAKEYTFLGICTKTINKTVKLTCSPSGKLS